jgi:hypothetical protein
MAPERAARRAPARREYVVTDEAPSLLADLRSGSRYRGGIDGFENGVLSGWAIDLAYPARALPLGLEAGGVGVADEVADQPREDLAEILPGNRAGFALDLKRLPQARAAIERALAALPAEAAVPATALTLRLDGGPRLDLGGCGVTVGKALAECRARIEAEPEAEGWSPAEFASHNLGDLTRGPRYRGGVDGLIGETLRGWAVDLAAPRDAATVALLVEGREVFSVESREHRPDLARFLDGNVAGFLFDLAALPPAAAAALAQALAAAPPEAPTPVATVALRIGAASQGARIDLGAYGVTAGALRARVAAPEPAVSPLPLGSLVAAPVPAGPLLTAPRGRAGALDWLIDHLAGDLAGGYDGRPARRFALHLAREIERSTTVSGAVKRHASEIAPLFDPFFYLERAPDPEEAIANPLLHYVLAGWRMGVGPCALFDPAFYRRRRGEVAGDPLLDFLRFGVAADIDPHPLFDMSFYRRRWLQGEAGLNPLEHYLELGGRERLDPSLRFDTARFLETYGLGVEVEAPLEHYAAKAAYGDFPLLPGFDAALYRYQIEVERGETLEGPAVLHYLSQGFADETVLPNLLFDPAYYRERNKLEFDGPALLHYLNEGRALDCHPFFSPVFYDQQRGETDPEVPALEHALEHPGAFISDPRMDQPIDPRLFAFVQRLVAENGAVRFHPEVYRDVSPDLDGFDDEALETHYRNHGLAEGRPGSATEALKLGAARLRDLPLGFVLDDYVSIYPDLDVYKERFVGAVCHYMLIGRQERRLIGKWRFRIADLELDLPTRHAPVHVRSTQARVEVGVLIHAFYPELLPELIAFAQNFRNASFDIFINIVDIAWTPEVHEQVRAICPGAFVMLSNDAGRDVGGFTRLLAEIDIARYDLFAFMHSKKSPHIAPERGEYWRKGLLRAIAGSPDVASECLRMFREDPSLGMIGAAEWRSQDMGKNVEQYELLLDLLDVRGPNRDLDYVSGFMFLVRSGVVARLYETLKKLDFEYGGDKDLDFHIDGQIAHGVERATPALVRQMGYQVAYR